MARGRPVARLIRKTTVPLVSTFWPFSAATARAVVDPAAAQLPSLATVLSESCSCSIKLQRRTPCVHSCVRACVRARVRARALLGEGGKAAHAACARSTARRPVERGGATPEWPLLRRAAAQRVSHADHESSRCGARLYLPDLPH